MLTSCGTTSHPKAVTRLKGSLYNASVHVLHSIQQFACRVLATSRSRFSFDLSSTAHAYMYAVSLFAFDLSANCMLYSGLQVGFVKLC